MNRNMDLFRLILFEAEGATDLDFSPYSQEEIYYHKRLLVDAGFVKGLAISGPDVAIDAITMKGHDFLDAARDDGKWKRFLEKYGSSFVGAALDRILDLLIAFVSKS